MCLTFVAAVAIAAARCQHDCTTHAHYKQACVCPAKQTKREKKTTTKFESRVILGEFFSSLNRDKLRCSGLARLHVTCDPFWHVIFYTTNVISLLFLFAIATTAAAAAATVMFTFLCKSIVYCSISIFDLCLYC